MRLSLASAVRNAEWAERVPFSSVVKTWLAGRGSRAKTSSD